MILFKPAVRGATPLIIGLAGPSKSGKTTSAIRLAIGFAHGAPVFMVNTERERGYINADKYAYSVYDLEEPFSPDRYREVIEAAQAQKPGSLIVDSVSHMHEGVGGLLDWHERELDRMAGNDFAKRERVNFAAWIKPKASEAQCINSMLRCSGLMVVCMRAKEKIKIVKGKDPEALGFQPICSDRMTFETTVTLILPPGSQGRPDLKAQGSELRDPFDNLIVDGRQIDEELGRKLAQWAAGNTSGGTAGTPRGDARKTGQEGSGGGAHQGIDYIAALKACITEAKLRECFEAIPPEALTDSVTSVARQCKAALREKAGA